MGFSVEILRGIKRKGYQLPTPIQRRAMPAILAGADVVGMARTGSGKTAAFVLPMLQRCVLSISRELSDRVEAIVVLERFGALQIIRGTLMHCIALTLRFRNLRCSAGSEPMHRGLGLVL